jgi:hypothetical protein
MRKEQLELQKYLEENGTTGVLSSQVVGISKEDVMFHVEGEKSNL